MSVVRVLLRNRSEVVLSRGSAGETTGSVAWRTVSGPAATDPERDAWRAVRAETELSSADVTLGAAGEPFTVELDSG